MDPQASGTSGRAQGAHDRLLSAEQIANALRLNILRVIGVAAFLVLEHLPLQETSHHWEQAPRLLLPFYLGAAVLLLAASLKVPPVARASRLAVPVLDMPMVFFIQYMNVMHATAPRAVGNFSLAIFLCLIPLAALSLERLQIVLALLIALVLQQILHLEAGEPLFGRLGGAVLLIGVTTLCDYARRRRADMVWALCGEQLKRERLGRYFSPTVAEEIQRMGDEASKAHLSEVTVLFSDLRDFTTLAERMETAAIVELLNEYFEEMVTVVFEHGGTLDKYIGDGLMVYFGAPVSQEDHAARAVRCALAMRGKLEAFNAARPPQLALRMGIGIHTGSAVVGSIGAPHRREYTAIGDTVNLAARIEQLCKVHGVDILVSQEASRAAGGVTAFRLVGETPVKGRAASVEIHAPAG